MLFIDNNRKRIELIKLSLLICLSLTVFACKTTPELPLSLNSIQFVDQSMKESLETINASLSQTDAGNLSLNMLMRNNAKSAVSFELNVNWYNSNFIATESASAWQRVTLQPKETHIFQNHSTNQNSSHYIVNIRRGGI